MGSLLDKRQPLRKLLYFNFNQSCDCFAAGFKHGFRVLNCEPFKQMVCSARSACRHSKTGLALIVAVGLQCSSLGSFLMEG